MVRVPTGSGLLLRRVAAFVAGLSPLPQNLRRGRRPRRPLFGLPPHFASNRRTRPVWVRAGALVCFRALRVGTRNSLPHPTAQGAVRVGFAKFWLPPANTYLSAHRAKARHPAALSGFGRTDTYTCRSATRLSQKAASLVPFLPRQERNRPPRRRSAVWRGAASPQLQTPQHRRTAASTQVKATSPPKLKPHLYPSQGTARRADAQLCGEAQLRPNYKLRTLRRTAASTHQRFW
jgi:hypothetical protein